MDVFATVHGVAVDSDPTAALLSSRAPGLMMAPDILNMLTVSIFCKRVSTMLLARGWTAMR